MASKRRFTEEESESDDDGEYIFTQINKRFKNEEEEEPEELEENEEHIEEEPEELEENGEHIEEEPEELKPNLVENNWVKASRKAPRRLWNGDDEIKVLKGMIDFHSEKGIWACDNLCAFYIYIKECVQFDFSRKQLGSKIKRLKEKYQSNKAKQEDGQELVFLKPHELKLFQLSKKIWDSNHEEEEDDENFWVKYPCLNESLTLEQFSGYTLADSGINFIKQRLSCIGNSKAKELEENWRNLQVAETQVKLMRTRLIQEQTELILDVIS